MPAISCKSLFLSLAPPESRLGKLKLLVIEDERKLAEYLKRALSEHNYVVDIAMDGISGLHLAQETQYDLILLDVMLPGRDGFSVLAELRKGDRVPILMLTARDKLEDRVRGLQDGADDYLSSEEHTSELQSLMRISYA